MSVRKRLKAVEAVAHQPQPIVGVDAFDELVCKVHGLESQVRRLHNRLESSLRRPMVLVFAADARTAEYVARGRGLGRMAYKYVYDFHHIQGYDPETTIVLVYNPERHPLTLTQWRILEAARYRFKKITMVPEDELVV